MKLVTIFILFHFCALNQDSILWIGNNNPICYHSTLIYLSKQNFLPNDLSSFTSVFVFSTAQSTLSSEDVSRLHDFVLKGGGLYIGADNWPMQAEANLIALHFFNHCYWGFFEEGRGYISNNSTSNELFKQTDSFPKEQSTSAFPLDYRLKVEVWKADQPLILSGQIGQGRIVLDGGYARFYCPHSETNQLIFNSIFQFLK